MNIPWCAAPILRVCLSRQGSIMDDCLLSVCCPTCVTCQMARELDYVKRVGTQWMKMAARPKKKEKRKKTKKPGRPPDRQTISRNEIKTRVRLRDWKQKSTETVTRTAGLVKKQTNKKHHHHHHHQQQQQQRTQHSAWLVTAVSMLIWKVCLSTEWV